MSTHKKNIKRQNTFDEKLYAVMEVLEKKRFNQDVAEEINIHPNSLSNWLRQYRNFGKKGLESNFDKKSLPWERTILNDFDYSLQFICHALPRLVHQYLSGGIFGLFTHINC